MPGTARAASWPCDLVEHPGAAGSGSIITPDAAVLARRGRRAACRARGAGSPPRARCRRRSAARARTARRSSAPRPRSPTRGRRRCAARRGPGPSTSPIAAQARAGDVVDARERRRVEARRRDVDRLLEVRARRAGRACRTPRAPRARRRAGGPRPRPRRPGTYSSTSSGAVGDGADALAPRRAPPSASSARITPWLADRPTGFTTHGKPTSGEPRRRVVDDRERAAGAPRRPRARRASPPCRGWRATAAGGLCGKPSRSPAAAATSTPWSSTATTASTPRRVVERRRSRRRRPRGRRAAPRPPGRPCRRPAPGAPRSRRPPRRRGRAAADEVGGPVGRRWAAGGGPGARTYHGRSWTATRSSPSPTRRGRRCSRCAPPRPTPSRSRSGSRSSGEQAGAYTYLMEFRPLAELGDDVVVQHHDDLSVAIPADSVEQLARRHARLQRRRHGDAEPEPAASRRRRAIADRPDGRPLGRGRRSG